MILLLPEFELNDLTPHLFDSQVQFLDTVWGSKHE